MSFYSTAFINKFKSLVSPAENNGCQIWIGPFWSTTGGRFPYGRIWHDGQDRYAHRIAWELRNGPIPIGRKVLHKCDNPKCQNPDHLFLGTQIENIADRQKKQRQAKGESQALAKLTAEQVKEIRVRHAEGTVSQTALAREYGMSQPSIGYIIRRMNWKHVE